MRLAKKSILYFISDIGVSVVGFLATLYFARILGDSVLGQYFTVVALLGWATIPTNGLGAAINKRISEGRDERRTVSAGLALGAVYGGVVVVVTVLGGRYVNRYVGTDISLYFAVLVVSSVLFTESVTALKGKKLVARAGFLRTFDRILRTGSQIAVVYIGYELLGLVVAQTASFLIAAAVGAAVGGLRLGKPRFEDFRSLYSYARYSWLGNMKGKTFGWMDILVLNLFVSSGVVGVYGVSWRLASVLVLVSNAVQTTLFPEVSEISVEGDREEVLNLLSQGLLFAGIFVIPGFFGAAVLGQDLLRVFGAEFTEGAYVLLILIVARAVDVYGSQLLSVINAVNRPDIAFRINAVFIVSNISLNFALVYLFGWYGAAAATALSSAVILLLSYRSVVEVVGKPEIPATGIAKQVVCGAAMSVAVLGFEAVLPVKNMYITVTTVFLGAGVYAVLLYAVSGEVRQKARSLVPVLEE